MQPFEQWSRCFYLAPRSHSHPLQNVVRISETLSTWTRSVDRADCTTWVEAYKRDIHLLLRVGCRDETEGPVDSRTRGVLDETSMDGGEMETVTSKQAVDKQKRDD